MQTIIVNIKRDIATIAPIKFELLLVIFVILAVTDGNTEESLLDCGVTVELLTLTETIQWMNLNNDIKQSYH